MNQQLEHFPFPVCEDLEKGIQNREMDAIQETIGKKILLERVKAGDGEKIFVLGNVYRVFLDRQNDKQFYLIPEKDDSRYSVDYLAELMKRNAGMMMAMDALSREKLSEGAEVRLGQLRHYFERELRMVENEGLAQGKMMGEIRPIHIGSFLNETLGRILYYLPDRKLTLHEDGEIRFVCNPEKLSTAFCILIAESLALADRNAEIRFDIQMGFRLTVTMTVKGTLDAERLEECLFEVQGKNPAGGAFRRLISDCKGSFFVRRGDECFTLVMRFADSEDDIGKMMSVDVGIDGYEYARMQLSDLLEDEAFQK